MLHRLLTLALLIKLAACGPDVASPETPPAPADAVARAALYRDAAPGWVDVDKCDSLLFTALAEAVHPSGVDITAAEVSPGRWLRRPAHLPECWAAGESRSTISRDGLLGVMFWAWRHNRLDVAERLWEYGARRDWFMGDDDVGGFHTYFTPAYVGTLAKLIERLGGPARLQALTPVDWTLADEPHEAHLQAIHAQLRRELFGGLSRDADDMLWTHRRREPANPLYAVLVGDSPSLPATLWPTDRLPTSADRCESWLPQRSAASADWAPCYDGRTHAGADLRFVVGLQRGPTKSWAQKELLPKLEAHIFEVVSATPPPPESPHGHD